MTYELPIIQKTYDFVKWYVPIIDRLPRSHKFTIGDRMIQVLYDLLEGLITARYAADKLYSLQALNAKLDVLRYQTRLLVDLGLMKCDRYEYSGRIMTEIGSELGGWIKQQKSQKPQKPQRLALEISP
jgi:hypothetical protein